MSDSSNPSVTSSSGNPAVVIPDETQKKFPDLVVLILESQSMNDQERNYWLQVLPVMTEDQVKELRDILETEKRKLAEIDKKYATPAGATPQISAEELARIEIEKRKKAEELRKAEENARAEENPESILASLNDL